jgi:hypothetical protein
VQPSRLWTTRLWKHILVDESLWESLFFRDLRWMKFHHQKLCQSVHYPGLENCARSICCFGSMLRQWPDSLKWIFPTLFDRTMQEMSMSNWRHTLCDKSQIKEISNQSSILTYSQSRFTHQSDIWKCILIRLHETSFPCIEDDFVRSGKDRTQQNKIMANTIIYLWKWKRWITESWWHTWSGSLDSICRSLGQIRWCVWI